MRAVAAARSRRWTIGSSFAISRKKVRGNLIRIGGFAPELIDSVMEEIVGMEQPYRYRNKAQFPIGADRNGMPVAGFYAARTHNIIPVEDCKLGVTQNEQILGVVLSYMRENGIRSYDETDRAGTGAPCADPLRIHLKGTDGLPGH